MSYCSECRAVILIGHQVKWQRAGATGMVHAECATDPDAQPVNMAAVTVTFPAL